VPFSKKSVQPAYYEDEFIYSKAGCRENKEQGLKYFKQNF
jgi:hypothetical protein